MSRGLFDNHKDIDSPEESDRRRSFIERMERKLEIKESVIDPRA